MSIEPEIVHVRDRSLAVRRRGSGATIVFVHGNSSSGRAFEKQLTSSLAERFRLIAVDLPGHGNSPPASRPEETNTLPGYAEMLALVASHLEFSTAVFVGWSLGGHVLLEASDHLPNAAGFLVVGTPPISRLADFPVAATDDPAVAAAFRADSTDEEVHALVSLFVRPGTPVPALFFDDFKRTDRHARAALAASLARNEMRDEIRVVEELSCPLAVVHGTCDRIVRNRGWFDTLTMPTLWRGAVQEISAAGHAAPWETPEEFNRLVEDFALDCLEQR